MSYVTTEVFTMIRTHIEIYSRLNERLGCKRNARFFQTSLWNEEKNETVIKNLWHLEDNRLEWDSGSGPCLTLWIRIRKTWHRSDGRSFCCDVIDMAKFDYWLWREMVVKTGQICIGFKVNSFTDNQLLYFWEEGDIKPCCFKTYCVWSAFLWRHVL